MAEEGTRSATPPGGSVLIQHLGAVAAANAGTIVGLGLGWSSAAASMQNDKALPISLEEWSWITSLYGIGAALGSIVVSKLVHSLGRRVVILAVGFVTAIAFALHVWASSVWMLYVGRLLVGMMCGFTCVSVPIFVCEMSQPHIRGALSTYFEILLCVGILIIYTLGKFMTVYWINVTCLVLSLLHSVGFLWFPDTPRWLLLRGRDDEAQRSMRFYRGPKYDVDAEIKLLKQGIKENTSEGSAWSAFTTTAAGKGLAIVTIMMIFQQVTGINAITFYASQLFTEAGTFDADTASILVAFVEVVSASASFFIVDRLGRRFLLLLSGVSMGVCTGLMGGYFYYKEIEMGDVSTISWLPIVVVSIYMFAFSIGFGPVVWVLVGELFPDNVKGVATGVASATGWFFSFVITKFYPGLAEHLGNYVCYWIFFSLCIVSCAFITFFVPETKGRTLDEIQTDLS